MNRSIRLCLLPMLLALSGGVKADDTAAASPPPDDPATLKADNKQLSDELAAAWKEADRLKLQLADAQAAAKKSAEDAADLQKQVDSAMAQVAKSDSPAPTSGAAPDSAAPTAAAPIETSAANAPDSDTTKQLVDTQDKLSTALRSFSVLQDENARLKDAVDKLTAENTALAQQLDVAKTSMASLQVQAATTSQIDPLRTELRQSQDEASRLATENAELKTRFILQTPGPGGEKVKPSRPPTSTTPPPPPADTQAAPAPAEKTYVVVEGDTLTRISRKFYGTANRWEEILQANRGVLRDEKSLAVGSTLRIP